MNYNSNINNNEIIENNLSNREIKAISDGLKENDMLICKHLLLFINIYSIYKI